jgi:Cys-tRNA(Pro)/Cys-tRNA(Cys) deacylase
MAATSTRATKALDALGVEYVTHTYEVDEEVGGGYGEAVAAAIGLPAGRVFKTLVAEANGLGRVAIIPVSMRLSTKALAKAAGAKRCAMGSPELAERLTGYVVGGVSPFGQRRTLPTFIDVSVSAHPSVAVSGGRRGLQLEVSPDDLLAVTGGTLARLTA